MSNSTDVEYTNFCMVDTLVDGTATRFTRLVNLSTMQVIDINPETGALYTVVGAVVTCEAYDLLMIRDPLDDLYENCQCSYTISQEDHRVTEIRGGAVQEYDVEFQEVVRRRCADQSTGVVVHRDTLTETGDITDSWKIDYSISFSSIGDNLDDVNIRLYDTLGMQQTVTVDLNPATVEASYPALTLASGDFFYNGSNLEAMADAYTEVLQHAVEAVNGPLSNTIIAVENLTFNSIIIRTTVRHQPARPYAIIPDLDDPDYLISGDPLPITQGIGALSLFTNTTNWTEECSPINAEHFFTYVRFSYDTPLDLQPELDPDPPLFSGTSTPTVFCDVSPAICAELAPDPVTLEGCFEVCSDVLNIAGHLAADDSVVSLPSGTYNSISIYVETGPVQVTIGGVPISYPTGRSIGWSASPNELLVNEISVDATGGEAIISFVR